METQRQIRFGELIRSIISDCLIKEDFYNENINLTSVTVSFVRMSKDLKIANVYFMPLGGKNKLDTLNNLNEKKYIFQKFLSKAKIQSKFTLKPIKQRDWNNQTHVSVLDFINLMIMLLHLFGNRR